MTHKPADPRRLARLALLTAVALTIFLVEAQLPVLPIPGAKLGLANIVTVYAVFVLGPGDALSILLVRVFLGAVFSGQMSTFFYSLSGGFLCRFGCSVRYPRSFIIWDSFWLPPPCCKAGLYSPGCPTC